MRTIRYQQIAQELRERLASVGVGRVLPSESELSAEFAADCLVLRYGSARLVELAEAKLRGRPGVVAVAGAGAGRPLLVATVPQPGWTRRGKMSP